MIVLCRPLVCRIQTHLNEMGRELSTLNMSNLWAFIYQGKGRGAKNIKYDMHACGCSATKQNGEELPGSSIYASCKVDRDNVTHSPIILPVF